jgi:hypothetical protein
VFALAEDGQTEGQDKKVLEQKIKKIKVDYKNTLRFEPSVNGIPPPLVKIEYDISDESIEIGRSVISPETFKVFMGDVHTFDPNLRFLKELENQGDRFVMSVPKDLFNSGKVEIISENGNLEWSHEFTSEDIALGRAIYFYTSKSIFKMSGPITVLTSPIPLDNIPILAGRKEGSYKVCLSEYTNQLFSRICSSKPPSAVDALSASL